MTRHFRAHLAAAGLDAWAALLPTACSGCGAADRALCSECRLALVARVHPVTRDDVLIWSALTYEGVARQVIAAFKDGGRTDAAAALAMPLRAAIVAALAALPPEADRSRTATIHLVTVPSSGQAWQQRGYHPVDTLLRRAGLRSAALLVQRGHTNDQVGLNRAARAANKSHSLRARRPLVGVRVLLVDDIVTTGATLLEARRAVLAAGGTVVGLATLAETRRLSAR